MRGTAGYLESLGFRPSRLWAFAAGLSEFGSGLLTSLGLFHPVGPITMLAPMWMALAKAHWDRPIWAQEGGGELAVVNMAAAVALATAAGIVAGSVRPVPTEQVAESTVPGATGASTVGGNET